MENNNIVINNNELTNKEETVMTNQEKARRYFAENTKPIYELCPIVKQRWETAAGTVYWDSTTMMRTYSSGDRWTPTVRGNYEGSYLRYIDDLDAIEIAMVTADGGRGKNGTPMAWRLPYDYARCLIFRGDIAGYFADGSVRTDCRYYSNSVVRLMMMLSNSGMVKNTEAQKSELERFGLVFNEDYMYYGIWRFKEYYRTSWVSRKVSKKATDIDEIVLDDVDLSYVSTRIALVIQPVEGYIVLRRFEHYTDEPWCEYFRVYVDKKGKPSVVRKSYGSDKWKISTRSIHCYDGDNATHMTVIGMEHIDNWDSLKYLKSIIDFENNNVCETLVGTLRHPIVEQLSKSGYPNIAKKLMANNQIAANLKTYFRQEKETKQSLYKLLGVNKWLLKAIEDMPMMRSDYGYTYDGRMEVLRMIKFFYDRFDISDIDKSTIDTLVKAFSQIDMYNLRELCGYTGWAYRNQYWLPVDDTIRKFIFKLIRMNEKDANHNIISYYLDMKRMYNNITNKPDIDLDRFNDFHGLEIIHDALVEIKTQEDAERQARWNEAKRRELEEQSKRFEKFQKDRREKFNAESDKYLIRVPNQLDEITKEGISLHHCVGGYLSRHASGNTNIIFLRRKEDPDTSFYTIEVNSHDRVVQIHGSYNKWLGNDPEAIPFVWKWIKERGFACQKDILLNLGAGYCSSNESLDESYLTKEVV